jgi:RimK family alpha-L-glutamate ligase
MTTLVITGSVTPTNVSLERAAARIGLRSRLLPPEVAARRVEPEDLVLGRVDVLPSLDGTQRGLGALARIENQGIIVLNNTASLCAAHDKLETASILTGAGVPHPRTVHVTTAEPAVGDLEPPYVLKPRFGSWGRDVARCDSVPELADALASLRGRGWYEKHGVLVQEWIPNDGVDVRLVVAGDTVVGAIARKAAAGEWRTNVSLGGRRERLDPDPEAVALAVDAVRMLGGDLMGVDLLPTSGGYVVLEVNGCVDFNPAYSIGATDVFGEALLSLPFARPGAAFGAGAAHGARLLQPEKS